MNLIINGFYNGEQINIIKNITLNFKVEKLFVFADDRCEPKLLDHPHTLFLVPNIIKGDYDIAQTYLDPLDSNIIDSMLTFEPIIMQMMDRFEVYLKMPISFDERLNIYYKHLRYWNHVLTHTPIDLYISANIPHDIYDYIILGLCKLKSIPTLFFIQSQIKDTIHPMTDYEKWTDDLPSEYNKLIYKHLNEGGVKLSPKVEEQWIEHVTNIEPFYMRKPLRSNVRKIKEKGVRFFNTLTKVRSLVGLKRKFENYKLSKTYKRVSQKPDFEKKYFYLPLHYQPELTTNVLGKRYVNQNLLIQLLDYYLPDEYYLYVKENPKQEICKRSYDYYQSILNVSSKRVIFVDINTDSFELIKNAKAIATVSGTAGWEALFNKKQVIMFGYLFYSFAPGVISVTTRDDVKDAINTIVHNEYIYEEDYLKLFLQAIENCSIYGFNDLLYKNHSDLSTDESANNIYNYIHKFISINLC
jgi:hypothetical protein